MKRTYEYRRDSVENSICKLSPARALQVCERFLNETSQLFGTKHRNTAICHSYIGKVFMELKRFGEAETAFKKAITITSHPSHNNCADPANYLLLLIKAKQANKGTEQEVESLFRQAANIQRKIFMPTDRSVTDLLTQYGNAVHSHYDDADIPFRAKRIIKMAEYMYGTGPLSCEAVTHIASSISSYGETPTPSLAEWLYKWALTRYEHMYGPNHAVMTCLLNNLASLYKNQGDLPSAINAMEAEKRIIDRIETPKFYTDFSHHKKLANLYHEIGEFEKEIATLVEFRALQEVNLGFCDIESSVIADKIGVAYLELNDVARALPMFKQALKGEPGVNSTWDQEHHTEFHLHLGNAYLMNASTKGRRWLTKAIKSYRTAFKLSRAMEEEKLELTAEILLQLKQAHVENHNFREALLCCRQAQSHLAKEFSTTDIRVAAVLNAAALIHNYSNQYRLARRVLAKQALPIAEEALGTNHHELIPILNNLGFACTGLKDYPAAIEYLKRAEQIHDETNYDDVEPRLAVLDNLCTVLSLNGQIQEALDYYEKALTIADRSDDEHPDRIKALKSHRDSINAGESLSISDFWRLE